MADSTGGGLDSLGGSAGKASSGGGFDWGGALGGVGSIVSGIGGLFASNAQASALDAEARGYGDEASAYDQAAEIERQNARLAGAAGDIQIAQQNKKNYETGSATEAALGGAGLKLSGSGLDVLRENMQQGSLASGLLGVQKAINVNTYTIQSDSYSAAAEKARTMVAAAEASAGGAREGGIFGAIGGVVSGLAKFAPLVLAAV